MRHCEGGTTEAIQPEWTLFVSGWIATSLRSSQ